MPPELHDKSLDGHVVTLPELVAYQVLTESGLDDSYIAGVRMLGISFSTGSQIMGTQKAEVNSAAGLWATVPEIFAGMIRASHKWETQLGLAATKEQMAGIIKGTFYSKSPMKGLDGLRTTKGVRFGDFTEDGFRVGVRIGSSEHAFGHWVPVGLATAVATEGVEFCVKNFPEVHPYAEVQSHQLQHQF